MLPLAVLMQKRAMWMLGVAILILDEHEQDMNFYLDRFFLLGMCLQEEAATNEVYIDGLYVHD